MATPTPASPQSESNVLDRKPSRRTLKQCDKGAEVVGVWEGHHSVLFAGQATESLTMLQ